jgi:hypothetical protein
VYVIWSESTELPADVVTRYSQNKYNKVKFLPQPTKSLNNRFRPLDEALPRTDAIFSTDDDMRVDCQDLERAYSVWRGSSRSLIGFMPRVHVRGSDGGLVYRCWFKVWWLGKYSIILTKVAMFHHDYMRMYTSSMPQSVRDLVDKERNCEDIAMQFLISNATHLPPIYIKGHLSDLGAFGGISTAKNGFLAAHMDKRSDCLNNLVTVYGKNPLVFSHIIVDAASNQFGNMPSTWQDFISSDLWKF